VVAYLEIFETEDVFGRIDRIAAQHAQRLVRLGAHPRVDEVRQIGTVAAVELQVEDAGYASTLKGRLYKFFLERDVLLRPLGHVVYVLPPYSVSREELDHVYEVIEEALEKIR
jgi:adenosylmethionine-8-amino-7-oxononanoate aminotransferase